MQMAVDSVGGGGYAEQGRSGGLSAALANPGVRLALAAGSLLAAFAALQLALGEGDAEQVWVGRVGAVRAAAGSQRGYIGGCAQHMHQRWRRTRAVLNVVPPS